MKKLTGFLLLLFGTVLSLSAQSSGSIVLSLEDELTGEAVAFATVSARPASQRDSTENVVFSLTDDAGKVSLSGLRPGAYILKAELMGYITWRSTVKVGTGRTDLGSIEMKEDVQVLEQAVVTAVGNPIVVKKDTIEFSASSVKTSDSDMLEDQLKKLPGFEVDTDGKITYNGTEINKIMIDGKTFFLDDPQLATKNLPAKIIEKVKVVEKKSDQAEFTGIDDGESETVLDLSVRPGMMNGWFGNVSGGGGLDLIPDSKDARFQGGAMIGRFTESSQISIIANANNTNNRGFNDIAGNMMRTMRSSMGRSTMGWGGGRSGITTSWMGGINANGYALHDNSMELEGNYLYSGSENEVLEKSTKTAFQEDGSSLVTVNDGQSVSRSDGHRFGGEMDWKLGENTSILFRPQASIGYGSFDERSAFSSENTLRGKLNDGENRSYGETFNYSTSGRVLFRQKLGKAGRTLSLNVNYSFSGNDLDGMNRSTTRYYADDVQQSVSEIDQRYRQREDAYSLGGRLSYTEPLGRNFFLEASYRYNYRQNNSEKYTYNRDGNGDYTVTDYDYSTRFANTFVNQTGQLNIMKQEEKYTAQIGFNVQPATTRSVETLLESGRDSTTFYRVLNFAPSARFDYRFSDYSFLRVRYNGWTNQPSITQLQPVRDNSNPLYISLGNPNLLPEFSHNLWTDFRHTDMATYTSVNANLNLSYTMDDIVSANWYDGNGVQYSAPVNSPVGAWSGGARVMVNSPIAKSKFSIMSFTNARFNRGASYSGFGEAGQVEDILDQLTQGITTSLTIRERLQFVYRDDWMEARLGGSAAYTNAWYTIKEQEKPSTWTNSVDADLNLTLPWGLELRSDARHTFYIGYEDGYGESQTVWNAEVAKLLFKKKATLRLKVYDILNQSRGLYRTTTDNYVQDVQNNTLGRYVMLTFTYRFGNFNQGGGPGGPMRHGPGGPMRRM